MTARKEELMILMMEPRKVVVAMMKAIEIKTRLQVVAIVAEK